MNEPLWKIVHHNGHMACFADVELAKVGDSYGYQSVRKLDGTDYQNGDVLQCDTCGAVIFLGIEDGQVTAHSFRANFTID